MAMDCANLDEFSQRKVEMAKNVVVVSKRQMRSPQFVCLVSLEVVRTYLCSYQINIASLRRTED
jgi:hypothetical protein